MSLPNHDAWLEPPDEDGRDGQHDEDCVVDHDPEDGSPCYSLDDLRADEADREYDRMKDGYE